MSGPTRVADRGQKMRKLFALLAASLFVLFSAGLRAQSAAPVTLVKAARLLDPRSGNVLSPAAVLIEDGKIKESWHATVDSRAHGESGGKLEDARQKRRPDLETSYQFLTSQPGVQGDVIGVAGRRPRGCQ